MRLPLGALTAALLIACTTPAFADKVTDAIRSGQSHYEDKRLSKAVRELRYAISQISRQLITAYEATMPPAPGGWTTRKARRRSSAGGVFFATGTTVTRNYRQSGGRGRLSAQLIVDNPMMQAFAAMFANPQIAANAGFERVRLRGVREDALVKFNPDTGQGEAMLLLAGRIFIKISGRRIESDGILRDMLEGWNYEDLKKVAEIK